MDAARIAIVYAFHGQHDRRNLNPWREHRMTFYEPVDPLLTRTEAASLMSVSISTIERRIKSGELRACKLGTGLKNAVRIRRSEVERFLSDSETVRDQSAA